MAPTPDTPDTKSAAAPKRSRSKTSYAPFVEVWAIVLGPTSREGEDLAPQVPTDLPLPADAAPVRVRLPLEEGVQASTWRAAIPMAADQLTDDGAYGTFWMPRARDLPALIKRGKKEVITDEFEEVKRP